METCTGHGGCLRGVFRAKAAVRKELQSNRTRVQRAMEHKGNILPWLIFPHFKDEAIVAYLFQLINCHHVLENEITHRMSDFVGSRRGQHKWECQWYKVNASKINPRLSLTFCHVCHMGAVLAPGPSIVHGWDEALVFAAAFCDGGIRNTWQQAGPAAEAPVSPS